MESNASSSVTEDNHHHHHHHHHDDNSTKHDDNSTKHDLSKKSEQEDSPFRAISDFFNTALSGTSNVATVTDDHHDHHHNHDDNNTKHDDDDSTPLKALSSFFNTAVSTLSDTATTVNNTLAETVAIPSSIFFDKGTTVKFIHINDVYELDYLAHFATCKQWESGDKVIGTISGDFLAPSLLSSLDKGLGMVDVLNKSNIDYASIGNHEADIPLDQLFKRIRQSNFTWINSNMDLNCPDDIKLPKYSIITVGVRKIALLGLNTNDPSIYSPTAFGGAKIYPLNETCKSLYEEIKRNEPDIDLIIPLTHQIMPFDRELAELMGADIPVILGGHDHEPYLETINGCTIVKTGADAKKIGIVELYWPDDKKDTKPLLHVSFKNYNDYSKHSIVQSSIDSNKALLTQLETATLCKIPTSLSLTSKMMRFKPTSMGTFICSSIKHALGTDVCLLAAGCIRANKDYTNEEKLTYANLKQEIPFDTIIVNIELPGSVITNMIEYTRAFALQEPPVEKGGYLQTDDDIIWNSKKNKVIEINRNPVKPDQLYSVSINQMILEGLDNIEPIVNYIKTNPKAYKTAESGTGLKEIIVSHFSKLLLLELLRESGDFNSVLDRDGDGKLNKEEVIEIMKSTGSKSSMLVDNLFNICDTNSDGFIDKDEINQLAITAMITMDRSKTNDKMNLDEHKNLMKTSLGSAYDESSAISLFKKVDVDGSGYITHGELRTYQRNQTLKTSRWSWI